MNILGLLIAHLFSTLCYAAVPILGHPTFEGGGCNHANTAVALTPDGQAISLLFDDYRVEAGNGTSIESKHCSIRLPMQIQDGYSVRIFKVDYRGFNSLSRGSSSVLKTEYEFHGSRKHETLKTKKFKGPLTEDFFDVQNVHARSECKNDLVLNLNIDLSVQTNCQHDRAFAVIDSSDFSQPTKKKDRAFKYHLVLDKCR